MREISISVRQYTSKDFDLWDRFVSNSRNGTFLHTRKFLSYHGDKFQDVSLIFEDTKGNIIGVFPSAIDLQRQNIVVSHPGITYGGIVHGGSLIGEKMLCALKIMMSKYREEGFHTIQYKAIPSIYHQVPTSDDLYALFRLGATRYRCDLSCVIDLDTPTQPSHRRQRGLKKALKNGVQVEFGVEFAENLWSVLEDNLEKKHGARPVHTFEEIILLHSLFPENIEFAIALYESQIVAGVVLFSTPQVSHAQYIASSSTGHKLCALDAVFQECIDKAKLDQKRYFSFGTSNEKEGKYLNMELYQFKSEFGSGGVVHEFYEIDIRK